VQHENIFLPDIRAAMEIMHDEVGSLDGNSNDCERVLSAAEEAVDGVFFRRNLYLEMA
jgi:SpoU rRNA methylase family enzyme